MKITEQERLSTIRDLKNKYPSMRIKDIAEMYDSIMALQKSSEESQDKSINR